MKIGIDISQSIYEATGVGEYTIKLVESLLAIDQKNEYVLFFSHARAKLPKNFILNNPRLTVKTFKIPIPILEFVWNTLHIFPIEWFIGDVDVFVSSDWLEPPTSHAKKVTTIHDLSVLKFPDAYDEKIKSVHGRKLNLAVKECDAILCDSRTTKNDVHELLGVTEKRLYVVYPGI